MKKIAIIITVAFLAISVSAFAGSRIGQNCTDDYQCGSGSYCYKEYGKRFGTCK